MARPTLKGATSPRSPALCLRGAEGMEASVVAILALVLQLAGPIIPGKRSPVAFLTGCFFPGIIGSSFFRGQCACRIFAAGRSHWRIAPLPSPTPAPQHPRSASGPYLQMVLRSPIIPGKLKKNDGKKIEKNFLAMIKSGYSKNRSSTRWNCLSRFRPLRHIIVTPPPPLNQHA